jgi:uncharacterized NAD(P)/FAD-binding protein YdhS
MHGVIPLNEYKAESFSSFLKIDELRSDVTQSLHQIRYVERRTRRWSLKLWNNNIRQRPRRIAPAFTSANCAGAKPGATTRITLATEQPGAMIYVPVDLEIELAATAA